MTRLILPSVIGRHISSTFYVQYTNTGSAAMPAPVLLLESSVAYDQPLFTLNKALVVSGFWTSAIPEGYSNTVEILASGKVPGVLEPGESVTVPVYYAGMHQPWNLSETQFSFDIRIFNSTDTDPVNWSSLQSSLQPAGRLGPRRLVESSTAILTSVSSATPGAATSSSWTTRPPTWASSART